ncbi:helicase, partial [Salmonella sp. NW805]
TDRLISYCLERDIEMSLHSARKRLSVILRSLGIESNGRAGRGNGIYYRLPASDDVSGWRAIRDAFAEKIGGNFEVVFGLTDI